MGSDGGGGCDGVGGLNGVQDGLVIADGDPHEPGTERPVDGGEEFPAGLACGPLKA